MNATPTPPSPRNQTTSAPLRPLAALRRSADILPRTKRGAIDVEASLRLWGITDPKVLWQQRFKPGTAGTALKCILGARGLKPEQPASERPAPDLDECPPEQLPLVPETGKLDLAACLAKFNIQDPSALWKKRFRPNTAGGRIKMCLRARGFDPDSADPTFRAATPQTRELSVASPADTGPAQPASEEANPAAVRRAPQGTIDIQASLQGLGIRDPKSLWQNPVEPGSAQHDLKKAIARALARREPVPDISRLDIGLSP